MTSLQKRTQLVGEFRSSLNFSHDINNFSVIKVSDIDSIITMQQFHLIAESGFVIWM